MWTTWLGTAAVLAQDAAGAGDDLDVESILGYILVGAVVGILARLVVPGREAMGWVLTIVLGIVGAVVGGWLAGAVFEDTAGVDWIASVLVAVALVLLARSTNRA